MKQPVHIKRRIISKILVSLSLVFVLGSAITQLHAEEDKVPIITIHSTGDVTRGGEARCVRSEHASSSFRWNVCKLPCQRHRYSRS
jgi:hypothetical protein